jgi:hypothetical protein
MMGQRVLLEEEDEIDIKIREDARESEWV